MPPVPTDAPRVRVIDHSTYLCAACRIALCDADNCRDPLHSSALHVGAEVYCRDCGEVPRLKAEVDRLTTALKEEKEATIAALRRPPTYEWAHNLATQRPGWTLEMNGRSDGRTGIDRDSGGYRPHAPGPVMAWCATPEEAVDALSERLGRRVPPLPSTEKP